MNINEESFVLAFDIGTTSTRSILFDSKLHIVAMAQKEVSQTYPKNSWVEQDPEELFRLTISTAEQLFKISNVPPQQIACIGITNQRETTIVWNKNTGKPIYNAIVWQDKRTADYCKALKDTGYENLINDKTGLLIDPYFSASKLNWILDNVDGARKEAEEGNLLFGTVDSYFIWRLTAGKTHVTDVSNASRTMLFNINSITWDDELLALFKIPKCMLPKVVSSSGLICHTDFSVFRGQSIPITGLAGDQQAALFGQTCFTKGETKNTYGTGCFILMNCGNKPVKSNNGLITTIAWKINDTVIYALEGSVFIAGSLIQWLRDELKIIETSSETEFCAKAIKDPSDIFFVPCFSGLGAPYWDMNARGLLIGLSLNTTRAHVVKAALESLAFQTKDVLEAMQKDAGAKVCRLNVDGGASVNDYLMQFQADIINTKVYRPGNPESTALGAAMLAGLAAGIWTLEDFETQRYIDKVFTPEMNDLNREGIYNKWLKAVERAKNWVDDSV